MKLNMLEFIAMNSPIRAFVQDKYELKILRSMSLLKAGQEVLEIGCGNGSGTRLIQKYFNPRCITAIDFDQRMIRRAQKKNKNPNIIFQLMDAASLDFPDNSFDAVFDFGIIHHIPNWKDCLSELKRVLKPGGELILEDLSRDSFSTGTGRLWKILSAHPYEFLYSPQEFTDFLKEIGFTINHYKEFHPLKFIRFFSLDAVLKNNRS